MNTFHKIVQKYRHGEAKYSLIRKSIKRACVTLELQQAIARRRWEELEQANYETAIGM